MSPSCRCLKARAPGSRLSRLPPTDVRWSRRTSAPRNCLEAGAHFLAADDVDGFTQAVLELARRWRDPTDGSLEHMVHSAREAVLPLTWPRIVEQLTALYRTELERRSRTQLDGARASDGTSRPTPAGHPLA